MSEPVWMEITDVIAIHQKQVDRFGGQGGVRDHGLLDSALARARHLWAYGETDLCELAAAYADGIANNHPFYDGNKRTAFVTAAVFLQTNGRNLTAPRGEPANMTLSLADKSQSREQYAAWLRNNIT
jgi:death-on-curing protein